MEHDFTILQSTKEQVDSWNFIREIILEGIYIFFYQQLFITKIWKQFSKRNGNRSVRINFSLIEIFMEFKDAKD